MKFGLRSPDAEAVDVSFQAHVGQAFDEVVAGFKWLHDATEKRFVKLETDLTATLQTLAGSAAPCPALQVPSAYMPAQPLVCWAARLALSHAASAAQPRRSVQRHTDMGSTPRPN